MGVDGCDGCVWFNLELRLFLLLTVTWPMEAVRVTALSKEQEIWAYSWRIMTSDQ